MFTRHQTTRDKLRHECKVCLSQRQKDYKRKRYQEDGEFRAKCISTNVKAQKSELGRKRRSSWYFSNKDKFRKWAMGRRSYVRYATPDWLTEDQIAKMKELYWLARDAEVVSGELYHVDHIVPLRGKNVCGLNVPWNLQVIPAYLNLSKGNRYE